MKHKNSIDKLGFCDSNTDNQGPGDRPLAAATLGLRLAAARRAAGYTQADLAERIGRGLWTLSRYERGVSLPSVLTLQRLAEVLGISLDALLEPAAGSAAEGRGTRSDR